MMAGVVFGSADFAGEMGLDPAEADLASVRASIAQQAHRLKIVAIDTPCFAVGDRQALAAECAQARRLGYAGKIAIHPAQVTTLHEHFTPSQALRQAAREMIEAEAIHEGRSTFLFRGRMVGPPFLRRAQALCDANDPLDSLTP